jgi:hypothetical protein
LRDALRCSRASSLTKRQVARTTRRRSLRDSPEPASNAKSTAAAISDAGARILVLVQRYSLIRAIPAAGSNSFFKCAGLSVSTNSQVGRACACSRCPPCAVPSRLPITIGFPHGIEIVVLSSGRRSGAISSFRPWRHHDTEHTRLNPSYGHLRPPRSAKASGAS